MCDLNAIVVSNEVGTAVMSGTVLGLVVSL